MLFNTAIGWRREFSLVFLVFLNCTFSWREIVKHKIQLANKARKIKIENNKQAARHQNQTLQSHSVKANHKHTTLQTPPARLIKVLAFTWSCFCIFWEIQFNCAILCLNYSDRKMPRPTSCMVELKAPDKEEELLARVTW